MIGLKTMIPARAPITSMQRLRNKLRIIKPNLARLLITGNPNCKSKNPDRYD